MAAAELTLDRLQQQVQGGTCRIAPACLRVENMIQTLSKDEMTRPFLSILPRLLSLIFGDETLVGWIEMANDEESVRSLWNLLKPSGVLFGATIEHSGLDCVTPFELPVSRLPVPLQRELEKKDGVKGLPIPLDSCIINVSREGPPLYILRLDSAEFYIYRLLIVLLSFHHKHHRTLLEGRGCSSDASSSPTTTLSRSHYFESLVVKIGWGKAFRFSNDLSAQLYRQLVESYLCYFMPIAGLGSEVKRKDETAFSTKFLRPSMGVWIGWRLASLFFTFITELWLHQHEYRIGTTLHIDSDPTFSIPTVDHYEVLRLVTRHIVTAVCYPLRPQVIPQQMQKFYDQLVDASFVTFRVYLYRLLRLSLAKCPSDNTITIIGGVWLDYIAPWRYLTIGSDRDESTMAWSQYVTNNYFFYHTLLGALLDYVEVIVEGFGEALSKSGARVDLETTRSALLPLLLLLARILAATSPFSELIREIEQEELLPQPTIPPSSTTITTSSSQTFLRRPNTNRIVKEQLWALESEKFKLLPLFDGAAIQKALRILFWLERIYGALPVEEEGEGMGSQSASLRHLADSAYEDQLSLKSTIMQCEEELCAIFGIREEDFANFSDRFEDSRRVNDAINLSDVTSRRRLIPAPLPTERIFLKMAKRTTSTVPTTFISEATLVKTYENALLVRLAAFFSPSLNKYYLQMIEKMEQYVKVPFIIKRIRFNLRFLAAYPNLAFIGLMYLALRIIWSIF